ncbi:MAG: hypothetical protein BM563_00840 [Bacteroidetes bacterium MedPE-SWsnd-G1]|nr:MAG: hypothetical protein BM563_00840 [Bacteroidetes bacterium MedPE-SWsnd-G1]
MIKFFRKIRQQLLSEGKTRKYFKYAIGEIVLVVIGILIALQINNWNEAKKSKTNVIQLMENVQKELILNINKANAIIAKSIERDDILHKINNKIYTREDYKNERELTRIISHEYPFYIADNAFANLMQAEDRNLQEFYSIINELKSLYIDLKQVSESTDEIEKKMVYDFANYLRDTKDWYATWNVFNYLNDNYTDEMYTYFLTDPSYFNFASDYFQVAIHQKFTLAHNFRALALKVYREIDEVLDDEKILHTKISPTPSYKLADYEHYVGSYKSPWGRAEIKIKDGKLFYSWDGNHGGHFVSEIYPINKHSFTYEAIFGASYMYTLQFNEKDEVVSLQSHYGAKRDLMPKIK